ncbi:hypothetical protein P8C59_007938 [Phyllachora maydis]|uniref:Nitronate monooxygenase domain-containing protein n=1 Tax=Phyllachora maydis TaxID=1825666 RepID=A0AAD9IA46_9PEZI|nr:hypothetical protein P8C59_007938 [Phyllachora maydis]
MAPTGPISTPLTQVLGIEHPIILAGMARVSGGALAAAVSNAGGLGVIGGFMYTPDQLRAIVAEMKSLLARPDLPRARACSSAPSACRPATSSTVCTPPACSS